MRMPGVSARPKLVEPSGFDTPARADLAMAIAGKMAADKRLADFTSVRDKVKASLAQAEQDLAVAEVQVEATLRQAAGNLIAKLSGLAARPGTTMTDLRLAKTVAEEDAATATIALHNLAGQVEEAEIAQAHADKRVKAAALSVLKEAPEVTGMLDEFRRHQKNMIRVGRSLEWLIRRDALPGAEFIGYTRPAQDGDPARFYDQALRFMENLPLSFLEGSSSNIDANMRIFSEVHRWEDAFAALQRDPNAALPA